MWIPQSGYLKVHEGYLRLSLTPIFQSYLEREHSFTFLDLGSYITYKGKQWLVEPDHFKVFEVMLSHSWGTISSVQSLSHVQLFATPWIAACQASLSINNSRNSLRLVSIKSVMPSNRLLLYRPLLLLCRPLLFRPSIFPNIRVFSSESALHIRWPKYWSFSFSISPSNEYSTLTSFRTDWFGLLAVQGTLKSLLQHHSSSFGSLIF